MTNYYSPQAMSRWIASNLLLHRGEFLPNPIVEIDEQSGEILSVEIDARAIDSRANTEFYNGVMVAGFINAHCHLELSHLRGAIEPGCGFSRFAQSIGALRDSFSREEQLRAMRLAEREMANSGIVAVGDIVNSELSFEIKGGRGLEYLNFAEVFGLKRSNIEVVRGLTKYPNCSLTQHSTYSLNDRIFKEIALSNDNTPLSIHFMESPDEALLFRGEGRFAAWYKSAGFECDFLGYGSPARRIVESIPATRSVMLVHNCCVTQEDIDIIMRHFTAEVYWVLSPQSNSYISGLKPPIELLKGYNIAIGTDSLSSNWRLSMLDELCSESLKSIPLAQRLEWATRGGAEALNLNHRGSIEVGKRPGINILSGLDYSSGAPELTAKSKVTRIL